MKKQTILVTLLLSAGIIGLSSYKTGPAHGGLGNRTGSTGSPNSCSQGGCHPSESSSLLVTLTLTDNATSEVVTDGKYDPGHEYTVKLSGAYSGASAYTHLGFQASVVNSSSADFGTIAATMPSTATVSAGVTLIEHTSPLAKTGDAYEASFRWTAPAAGGGDAKFYARMVVNNNNNTPGDDTPNKVQVTFSEKGVSGLADLDKKVLTNIYPNPSEGLLHIKMTSANTGNYSFAVRDISGRTVLTQNYTASSTDFEQAFDINRLTAGVYTLAISNGKQVRVLQFVKK